MAASEKKSRTTDDDKADGAFRSTKKARTDSLIRLTYFGQCVENPNPSWNKRSNTVFPTRLSRRKHATP